MAGAARPIAEGKIQATDMRRIGDHFFLEAAGIRLDAGLFAYFQRLKSGGHPLRTVRAALLHAVVRAGLRAVLAAQLHLALIARGRPLPPPSEARTLRVGAVVPA